MSVLQGDMLKRFAFLLALFSFAGLPVAQAVEQTGERTLDDFQDITPWRIGASDDVKASMRADNGIQGNALCVDFDFGAVSGYVTLSRALPLDYAENFEFRFGLRGDAPVNTLQFKLVDDSGENVWWANRPDYAFAHDWQSVRLKKRHISFAWGPSRSRELQHSAKLEFVIARGRGGGKGSVCFDQLSLRALPNDNDAPMAPVVSASSSLSPTRPDEVIDGAMDSAWRSDPRTGRKQWIMLDLQKVREFGGVILHWLPGAHASRYKIEFSDDGRQWRQARRVTHGNGEADPIFLAESEARYIRVHMFGGPGKSYALAEIQIQDLAFGSSPNAFIQAIAKAAPRGRYPRAFLGEQSYWTVLGIDGGLKQGLLSEDGAIELGPESASIEPFLSVDGQLITWADVQAQQSLLEGYLPIASVSWLHADLTLRTTAFAIGTRDRSELLGHYTITNHSDRARDVTLALAIRPYQVNPPTQFLNVPGGVSPVRSLAWDGRAVSVNQQQRIWPIQPPDQFLAADFDAGDIAQLVARARNSAGKHMEDDSGMASAVLVYRLRLPPGGSRSVGIVAPLTGSPVLPAQRGMDWLQAEKHKTAAEWRRKLNFVSLHLPAKAQPLADTMRSALAHILIERAGPALHPGTRSYARSWIRDGSMMSDALLRLGHADVVREYTDWFAPHQFSNGKVPCCVDHRGADPVAENDSQGELIYLIAQHYRYTRDLARLRQMWPHVLSAASYMDGLRATQRTAQNQSPERRAFYGLMPASISHEGYSDRPAYSYWDDFWSLAGYTGAAEMAQALGLEEAASLGARREEFRSDLQASILASMAQHGIDFIPASADRGDFDPTSTTIALSVAGQQEALPQRQLYQTFERYWQEFAKRRDGNVEWTEYTPYELRQVGAFVRLGWPERATSLLDFFLGDRRPVGWNQWAEVVGREARQPRFIGDMPHAWIASDFIQSLLDMLAYVRPEDQALVVAAGVPADWLENERIDLHNLRTPYGKLSYALGREGQRLMLTIDAGLTPPPGGLIFRWPYAAAPGTASVNGRRSQWERGNELRIRSLPAVVSIAVP